MVFCSVCRTLIAGHSLFLFGQTISIVGVPLAHLHWRMCTLVLYPLVIDDLENRMAHYRAVSVHG